MSPSLTDRWMTIVEKIVDVALNERTESHLRQEARLDAFSKTRGETLANLAPVVGMCMQEVMKSLSETRAKASARTQGCAPRPPYVGPPPAFVAEDEAWKAGWKAGYMSHAGETGMPDEDAAPTSAMPYAGFYPDPYPSGGNVQPIRGARPGSVGVVGGVRGAGGAGVRVPSDECADGSCRIPDPTLTEEAAPGVVRRKRTPPSDGGPS